MDAHNPVTLYVERITEPYSGMELLGVGGYCDLHLMPATICVYYDAEIAAQLTPTPHDANRCHFSTQLPIEPEIQQVRVVARTETEERLLYDAPSADIGARCDLAVNPPVGLTGRLLGVCQRGFRSVLTGEIISPYGWHARCSRFLETCLRVKQKIAWKLMARRFRDRSQHDAYVAHTTLSEDQKRAQAEAVSEFAYTPTISILVPVYNVEPRWLQAAIQSVQQQIYPHWELCIADDASTRPDLLRYYKQLPRDARIRFTRRASNGHICAASNAAAALAQGEFVALLDHDDALAPHALLEIVRALQQQPDLDLIYSDEDKIDAENHRYDPQFKPDWSPELLLSYNYINHFTCIRRSVFEAVGRFRPGFEGSQDHDLLLRVTERTEQIHHIPKILYHWRSLPSSTATAAGVKTYVHTAGRKAIEEALIRRNLRVGLSVPPVAQRLGVPILALEGTADGPRVAIVVYGPMEAATQTMQAIRVNTAYRHATPYLFLEQEHLAAGLNRICRTLTEEVVVFLQAGLVPVNLTWLSRMLAYLSIPDVGATGGAIRGESGHLHAAGTILGLRDGIAPGNAFTGLAPEAISYYFYAEVARNVTAPSRGVLATRRADFLALGGFDSHHYPDTLFDVDYCLRLQDRGQRTVHVGGAEFQAPWPADERHDDPRELAYFREQYGRRRDRYHNPNCSERVAFEPLTDGIMSLCAGTTEPMRAVIAAHNLNSPEGAPRYLSEIVLGLRRRGMITPAVLSPLGGAGAASYTEEDVPVAILDAPWSRRFVDGLWTPREYEACLRTLRESLKKHPPEVVIANTLLTFPMVEAAAQLGITSVWIIHESYSTEHLHRLFPPYAIQRIIRAFRLAARVIPASHDTAELFQQWNVRGNLRVLHNGLDAAPFEAYIRSNSRAEARAGLPFDVQGKKLAIAVGTVCERKGQHLLVEAMAQLHTRDPEIACCLVGLRDSVPYGAYVRELVRRRGLEGVVHLVPETPDVWQYYRAADLFVCTSYMETFSRAVLEAEAFGLPIVSSTCCGVSEQVAWGYNAFPFSPGDIHGLTTQLGRVFASDALRQRMAAQSWAMFDTHLNEDEMLDRYEAVIRSATQRYRVDSTHPVTVINQRQAA